LISKLKYSFIFKISELSAEYVSFGEKSQLGADFHQEIGSMPKSKVDSKDTASSRGVLIKDPILYVYTVILSLFFFFKSMKLYFNI